jgi:hypothetical protein
MHLISNPVHKNVKTLSKNTLIFNDTFDQDQLKEVLQDQQIKYIISATFGSIKIPDVQIYCLPLFLEHTANNFFHKDNTIDIPTTTNKNIFNFVVNKKQVNRCLCLKLVEFFNLKNYDYTWSGVDNFYNDQDLALLSQELTSLGTTAPFDGADKDKIFSPINIVPKFFYSQESQIESKSGVNNYGSNHWTWNNGLGDIFTSSAVSLITESQRFQKGTVFTEKTAYAIMGLTFPIWVGGYQQAEEFKKIGFDPFDDIVDHSYQHYNTLIERCYYAFKNNLSLLTDHAHVHELRNSHMDRLNKNFEQLKNYQVWNFCQQQIAQWPSELQDLTRGLFNNYNSFQHLFR